LKLERKDFGNNYYKDYKNTEQMKLRDGESAKYKNQHRSNHPKGILGTNAKTDGINRSHKIH